MPRQDVLVRCLDKLAEMSQEIADTIHKLETQLSVSVAILALMAQEINREHEDAG